MLGLTETYSCGGPNISYYLLFVTCCAVIIIHSNHNTFGCLTGYEYSFTLPKSSPVAINLDPLERSHALTSVPSALSGHIPMVENDKTQVFEAQAVSLNWLLWVTWRQSFTFPKRKIEWKLPSQGTDDGLFRHKIQYYIGTHSTTVRSRQSCCAHTRCPLTNLCGLWSSNDPNWRRKNKRQSD